MSDEEYEVEKILEKRTNKGRQIEYLVKVNAKAFIFTICKVRFCSVEEL